MQAIQPFIPSQPLSLLDLSDETLVLVLQCLRTSSTSLEHASLVNKRLFHLCHDWMVNPRVTVTQGRGQVTIDFANTYTLGYSSPWGLHIVNRETGESERVFLTAAIAHFPKYSLYASTTCLTKNTTLLLIDHTTGRKNWFDLSKLAQLNSGSYHMIGCMPISENSLITFSDCGWLVYWTLSNGVLEMTQRVSLGTLRNVVQVGKYAIVSAPSSMPRLLNLETSQYEDAEIPEMSFAEGCSKTNSDSFFLISSNNQLSCYCNTSLNLQWQAQLSDNYLIYLANDRWVVCSTKSGDPRELIIYDAQSGKLATIEPMLFLGRSFHNHVLCENYFISWNESENACLQVYHIPSGKSENIDLSCHVPKGQSYTICHAKIIKNRFLICLAIKEQLHFIECLTKTGFDGAKQILQRGNITPTNRNFPFIPWSPLMAQLDTKSFLVMSQTCRMLSKVAQTPALNPKITHVAIDDIALKLVFVNSDWIGIKTIFGFTLINRATEEQQSLPDATCLAQGFQKCYFSCADSLLVLSSNAYKYLDFDAAGCIPLSDTLTVLFSKKGCVAHYENGSIKKVFDFYRTIISVRGVDKYAIIQCESGSTILFDLTTYNYQQIEIPPQSIQHGGDFYTLANNHNLEKHSMSDHGRVSFSKNLLRLHVPYTLATINDRWLLCCRGQDVRLVDIKSEESHLELLCSEKRSLCGDFLLSWDNHIKMLHIPTRRELTLNLLSYLKGKTKCIIADVKFQNNRLFAVVNNASGIHILELVIPKEQIKTYFLKGSLSEAEMLEP